jgi:hypothetical protein
VSDHIGPVVAAEVARRAQHPYAGHPAASVLADHLAPWRVRPAAPVECGCGEWRGPSCDHPAHLAEVLHQAGLLKHTAPPPTLATCRHCPRGHPRVAGRVRGDMVAHRRRRTHLRRGFGRRARTGGAGRRRDRAGDTDHASPRREGRIIQSADP